MEYHTLNVRSANPIHLIHDRCNQRKNIRPFGSVVVIKRLRLQNVTASHRMNARKFFSSSRVTQTVIGMWKVHLDFPTQECC